MSKRFCLNTAAIVVLGVLAGIADMHAQQVDYSAIEGYTQPYKVVKVASPESGILVQLDIEDGQSVDANQIIAKLNSDRHQAMLDIAKAGTEAHGRLDAAAAEVALRKGRLDRLRELAGRGHARVEEITRAETDLEIARGQFLSVQEDLVTKQLEYERFRIQLEWRSIRAPSVGVVTQVYKQVGEFVGPGDPVIAEVVQLHPLIATFMVTQSEAEKHQVDGQVNVRMTVSGVTVPGVVEFVSPTTEAESGLVRLKVRVENMERQLRSGEACTLLAREPTSKKESNVGG